MCSCVGPLSFQKASLYCQQAVDLLTIKLMQKMYAAVLVLDLFITLDGLGLIIALQQLHNYAEAAVGYCPTMKGLINCKPWQCKSWLGLGTKEIYETCRQHSILKGTGTTMKEMQQG